MPTNEDLFRDIIERIARLDQRVTDYIDTQEKVSILVKTTRDELKQVTDDARKALEKKTEDTRIALADKQLEANRKVNLKIAIIGILLSGIALVTPIIILSIKP